MDSTGIITAMILVCLGLILLMVLARPLKFLLRTIVGAVFGSAVIALLHMLGLNIGVNFLTAAFAGFLGIPGLAGLFLLCILL